MLKYIFCLSIFLLGLQTHAQVVNKVLIIGIDGCRADALQAANTPNLDALIANASYSMDALNDRITSSGPGWSSMLTGVWPDKHLVVNNSFVPSNFLSYPHFFKYIEDHNPALHTVSIAQWHPVNNLLAAFFADTTINTADATASVAVEASAYLGNQDPDAIFVHFDDVDHAGHAYGFSPNVSQYISAIEIVDLGVGNVIAALNNRPNIANENWAVIVSTDHGGLNTSHGGNSFEEENIFLIVSGDSILNQEVSRDSSFTAIPPLNNCFQDSVELYFDGSNDQVQMAFNSVYDFGSSQDFSIECRIRTSVANDVSIVSNKDWVSGSRDGYVFSFKPSSDNWKINVGDGSNRIDLEGNNISDNEWHTLSATFDRDGFAKIFEDGVLIDSVSMTGIGDINTGLPLTIGSDGLGGFDYEGHIAEVRIFDALLDGMAIDTWKCTPLSNNHAFYANLIGYWRLTEGGNATICNDLSTSNSPGTLTGATWQNAQDTLFTWTYDYSNTPRTPDVAVSALEHLCIPIDQSWNLDGQIFGTHCSPPVGITETKLKNFQTSPNPVSGKGQIRIQIELPLPHQSWNVQVYDLQGKLIAEQLMQSHILQLPSLSNGVYQLVASQNGHWLGQRKINIQN